MFELHPVLATDTRPVLDLPLCRVLLMNDAQYPWLILVPRLPDLREVHDLPAQLRAQLWAEVDAVAEALAGQVQADKMNIAALGNQVPQLHVHCIARFRDDAAWPRPVWGVHPPRPYDDAEANQCIGGLKTLLAPLTDAS